LKNYSIRTRSYSYIKNLVASSSTSNETVVKYNLFAV